MARKIIDPRGVHLVHMAVLCRNGFCSTRCSVARPVPQWEANKDCEKGNKERLKLEFFFQNQMKSELSSKPSGFRFADGNMWQPHEFPGPGYQRVCCLRYSLAERDNANVTSPSVLMVCFVSFTGGNQIQWTDCGTNDPGQSSCTGVGFQPLNDDVTAPLWQSSVSLSDQLFTAFNWISWIQIARGIHFQ